MPLIAGMLNFGWEICALYSSGGYWVHVVWLILDCMILAYNTVILGDYKKRLIYLALLITFTCLLYRVFQSASFDGMLISSFAIDAIMAIEYLVFTNKLSERGRVTIGITRLCGDIFAWIDNMQYSTFVLIIGITVLVINLLYVSTCLYYQEKQFSLSSPSKGNGAKKKRHRK